MCRSWVNDLETYRELEEKGNLYTQTERELPMPKVSEMYGGSYLKAADLNGKRVRLVIASVDQVLFTDDKGGEESKWVCSFKGKDKQLVMNKTNASTIATLHGEDTDDWIGKEIRLYPTTTDLRGEVVPCIRVWLDPPDVEEAQDDEIPF